MAMRGTGLFSTGLADYSTKSIAELARPVENRPVPL
jgi:hypothetical protein